MGCCNFRCKQENENQEYSFQNVEQIRKDIESCDCQDKLETLLSHKEKGWRLYHKMKSGENHSFTTLIRNKEHIIKSKLLLVNEDSLKETEDQQSVLQWILSNEFAIKSLIDNYREQSLKLKDKTLVNQFKEFYSLNADQKELLDNLNKIFLVENLPSPIQRVNIHGMTPNPEIRNMCNNNTNETSINQGMNEAKDG